MSTVEDYRKQFAEDYPETYRDAEQLRDVPLAALVQLEDVLSRTLGEAKGAEASDAEPARFRGWHPAFNAVQVALGLNPARDRADTAAAVRYVLGELNKGEPEQSHLTPMLAHALDWLDGGQAAVAPATNGAGAPDPDAELIALCARVVDARRAVSDADNAIPLKAPKDDAERQRLERAYGVAETRASEIEAALMQTPAKSVRGVLLKAATFELEQHCHGADSYEGSMLRDLLRLGLPELTPEESARIRAAWTPLLGAV